MYSPDTKTNEEKRIAVLRSYNVLDTLEESDFDEITSLASAICQTPISLITLVDSTRQWFKSHKGLTITETPIEQSFCASAITTPNSIMIVENAKQDDRFKNNVLVTGEPYISFYAGVPLVTYDGFALGSLCVIDHPDPGMLSTLIEQTSHSINRISSLTDHLLNAATINQGHVVLNKSSFNVAGLLHACLQEISNPNNQEFICQADGLVNVEADEPRIEQVVINFLNNAIKYAPGSKVIYLGAENENGHTKIFVRDEGPGISEERLAHLFDRYYRNEYSHDEYSGLGLGLYICSEIIKLHGGQIGVKSAVGQGSTFWITIP